MVDLGVLGGALSEAGLGAMRGFMGPSWDEDKAAREQQVREKEADIELKKAHALYYGRPTKPTGGVPDVLETTWGVYVKDPVTGKLKLEHTKPPDAPKEVDPEKQLQQEILGAMERTIGKPRGTWTAEDLRKPEVVELLDDFNKRDIVIVPGVGAYTRDYIRKKLAGEDEPTGPAAPATGETAPSSGGTPAQRQPTRPAPRTGQSRQADQPERTGQTSQPAGGTRYAGAYDRISTPGLELELQATLEADPEMTSPLTAQKVEELTRALEQRRSAGPTTTAGTPPSQKQAPRPSAQRPGTLRLNQAAVEVYMDNFRGMSDAERQTQLDTLEAQQAERPSPITATQIEALRRLSAPRQDSSLEPQDQRPTLVAAGPDRTPPYAEAFQRMSRPRAQTMVRQLETADPTSPFSRAAREAYERVYGQNGRQASATLTPTPVEQADATTALTSTSWPETAVQPAADPWNRPSVAATGEPGAVLQLAAGPAAPATGTGQPGAQPREKGVFEFPESPAARQQRLAPMRATDPRSLLARELFKGRTIDQLTAEEIGQLDRTLREREEQGKARDRERDEQAKERERASKSQGESKAVVDGVTAATDILEGRKPAPPGLSIEQGALLELRKRGVKVDDVPELKARIDEFKPFKTAAERTNFVDPATYTTPAATSLADARRRNLTQLPKEDAAAFRQGNVLYGKLQRARETLTQLVETDPNFATLKDVRGLDNRVRMSAVLTALRASQDNPLVRQLSSDLVEMGVNYGIFISGLKGRPAQAILDRTTADLPSLNVKLFEMPRHGNMLQTAVSLLTSAQLADMPGTISSQLLQMLDVVRSVQEASLLSSGAITEEEADQRRHARMQEILTTLPAVEAAPVEPAPERRPTFGPGRPQDQPRRRPSLVGP